VDSNSKHVNPLRQLGKKVFQLREAIVEGQGGLLKQAIGITNAVRQIHGALPPDGFMLSMHPSEKVYQNPAVLPGEVLKYAQVKPLGGAVQWGDVNEFYERMEQTSQLAVLDLDEETRAEVPHVLEKRKSQVTFKILEYLFAKKSEKSFVIW
jgi:hypothetical protein